MTQQTDQSNRRNCSAIVFEVLSKVMNRIITPNFQCFCKYLVRPFVLGTTQFVATVAHGQRRSDRNCSRSPLRIVFVIGVFVGAIIKLSPSYARSHEFW